VIFDWVVIGFRYEIYPHISTDSVRCIVCAGEFHNWWCTSHGQRRRCKDTAGWFISFLFDQLTWLANRIDFLFNFFRNLNTIQKVCVVIFVLMPFSWGFIDSLLPSINTRAEMLIWNLKILVLVGSFLGIFLFNSKDKRGWILSNKLQFHARFLVWNNTTT